MAHDMIEVYTTRGVNISEIVTDSKYSANYRRPRTGEQISAQADGMKANGLPDPIKVLFIDNQYHLIAGDLRLAGAQLLGWETIQADVYEPSKSFKNPAIQAAVIRRLSDGVQDLTFGDRVRSIRRLTALGMKPAEIVNIEKVGLQYVQMVCKLNEKLVAFPDWEDSVTLLAAQRIAALKGVVAAFKAYKAGEPLPKAGPAEGKQSSGRAAAAARSREPFEQLAPWFKDFASVAEIEGVRILITPKNKAGWIGFINSFGKKWSLPFATGVKQITEKELRAIEDARLEEVKQDAQERAKAPKRGKAT